MRVQTLVLGILMASMSVGMISCAPAVVEIPVRSMPEGATFTGVWNSNFGLMKLTQMSGGRTRGSFDYKSGRLDGTVEGGVYRFYWLQEGDFSVGRREVSGYGYLVISDDGLSAEGEWGYGEKYRGGGLWTAEKTKEYYH